jgi:hypothetical protein
MNKQMLQQLLDEEGIRRDCYDLAGGMPPEKYVLAKEGNMWSVYYSEHGLQSNKRQFATEDEACAYLLELLRNDPLIKN